MHDDTRHPRDGQDPPARRHLKLVHPTPPPTPDDTPRGRNGNRRRHETILWTAEESARLRAGLKNARAMFGTWACLADAMHVRKSAVQATAGGKVRVSGAIAIRLARALGIPLEALLRGLTNVPKVCPTCGARRVP